MEEAWFEALDEALRYFMQNNFEAACQLLIPLHQQLHKPPESQNQIHFYQEFSDDLNEAESYLKLYLKIKDPIPMYNALQIYFKLLKSLENLSAGTKYIHLKNCSPKLKDIRNTVVVMPGTFNSQKRSVYVSSFHDILKCLSSKRKPRRMKIFGSDGKEYEYLLKGHEDLRLDSRVMQLLSLVNTLLQKNDATEKKNLEIITYPVIPLSTNSGILGWVQNCDTIQVLISDYRIKNQILPKAEKHLKDLLAPNYDMLPIPNKVEIFRQILENSKGDDLKKILWINSQNAEKWLEKRTNYSRSLATMSMVGYILGLGDRHLSNLMMERASGKIVHIDFGDCFEVTRVREKFPEKVPFRLTRVLINAMESCGIEGNYRFTCEAVMQVIRENRESIMAILEAFIWDPLLNWK